MVASTTIKQPGNWLLSRFFHFLFMGNIMDQTGIYQIKNLVNEKLYIGETGDGFETRWKSHKRELKGNYHNNKHLQRSWNKYGECNFEFSVVEIVNLEVSEIETKRFLVERESFWIEKTFAWKSKVGYNKRKFVNDVFIYTDEVKKKMQVPKKAEHKQKLSDYMNDFWKTVEGQKRKEYLSKINKGKKSPRSGAKLTEEHKQKFCYYWQGRKRYPETVKKMSEAMKGSKNPNYGKPRSEETKRKIRASRLRTERAKRNSLEG